MAGPKSKYADDTAMLTEALRLRRTGATVSSVARELRITVRTAEYVLELAEKLIGRQYDETWNLAVSQPWVATNARISDILLY